mmetsp:Transcript_75643/g.180739  ORF Transcript_75643/g.180739 Transcript_75643/m.180739 type:complete len:90 (+) Transcript_75643:317-586(+)
MGTCSGTPPKQSTHQDQSEAAINERDQARGKGDTTKKGEQHANSTTGTAGRPRGGPAHEKRGTVEETTAWWTTNAPWSVAGPRGPYSLS